MMTVDCEVSFSVTRAERKIVNRIVDRIYAEKLDKGRDRLDWVMDLVATHANGNPMDFSRLLAADGFNFVHDIAGICRHLNRETGQLENFFSPRASRREASAAAANAEAHEVRS